MTTWILVCDAVRSKLFSVELREKAWKLIHQFEHPEGRQQSRDMEDSAPPGRMQQGRTMGGRRTALRAAHLAERSAEAARYAHQLSSYLEEAWLRKYDKLVLVSTPHFLGVVHGDSGRQTAKHLMATVDKDFGDLDDSEISKRLIDTVFPLQTTTDRQ